jgi:hypothetical protein
LFLLFETTDGGSGTQPWDKKASVLPMYYHC